MLKLVNIVKDYLMKDQEPVHALKGLTVNFRRNEFVAILGPSGCGKTTLLNIVGGLDRYTSGDLIIEGKSTKDYKDGDWDTYRNHSIGFVFQSYNLIPHQSILRNVELALTIDGVSKEERKERAYQALEKVGLNGLEKKKPNQLSGGQMQRVAIARALINNPEILLADEPTGALDSETSIQVMDLLKEVAKDCLVIMVTHNPDLANTYANRIILMKDGVLTSDSNPYSDELEKEDYQDKEVPVQEQNVKSKKAKKSAMSFVTATALSLSNLFSKLKRTILVAIAGSIGIVGVSAVLAVSNGVHNFIDDMQDDMLSNYPLTISETSIDLASLISGLSNWDGKEISKFDPSTQVGIDSMIDYLMTKYKDIFSVKNNDINDDLLAYINQIDEKELNSLKFDYNIDVTNNIYAEWNRGYGGANTNVSLNGLTQMYISSLATVENFGQYAQFVNLFTDFMHPLPENSDFVLSQYDLLGNSRMPTEPNEFIVVVDENQTLTDILFAQLGFFTEKEFLDLAQRAIKQNDGEPEEVLAKYETYPDGYDFDQFLNKKYYYLPDIYKYDTITTHKIDFTIDISMYAALISEDFPQEIEFNLEYNESGDLITGTMLGLPLVLTRNGIKPLSPNWVGEWSGSFSIQGEQVKYEIILTDTNEATFSLINNGVKFACPPATYTHELKEINAYQYNGMVDDITSVPGVQEMRIVGILKKKDGINFGSLGRGVYFSPKLSLKYMADTKNTDVIASNEAGKEGLINYIQRQVNKKFEAYVTFEYTSFAKGGEDKIEDVKGYASSINNSANSGMSSYMNITSTSTVDVNRATLRSLSGLSSKKVESVSQNYEIGEYPQTISIYPKDFASKRVINEHLDKWNADVDITVNGKTLKVDDRQELTYTDTVEMIITVINTMIEVVTIALVAFSSLSLVVSCFMIAVITYISTMERVKEIGVIRSLGGRKKDVSRLFVAECLIIGLGSGLIGIATTYLLSLIINLIVAHYAAGITSIAALPFLTALIMIALSIVLNVLSGLIPAMKASNQDPVIALRSE